ncbi:beta-ketoacyl-ACP reductase [Geothrix limicola]|uniref:Beta-ketoacyl-ACP reductase n=1 Tax=Geothrix limicola TaxID=2927978 RepID=A0ABQ5QE69_9BACT|nr:SDR family oxidoreductase [Geothrix limicola]GLH72953.1 beta-ketoacyl-ACP reductase [Geothrix limicola]
MTLDLANLRTLVTGGSRGIGAATVRLLARHGAKVAFTYLKREDEALALQSELAAAGHTVLAIRADQRRREDAQVAVAAVEAAWGGLDAFVGNAGIWAATPAELEDETVLLDILETNVTGLFRWHAEVIPALKRAGGGHLVLLSSTAGQRGESGHGAYAASKGAVISLVKSLAPELGPAGIRVNAVAPGWVDTDLSAPALRGDPAQRARIAAIFPLGRIPEAEDLAGPVAFLLSPWASAITGEVLNVNGGTVLCG